MAETYKYEQRWRNSSAEENNNSYIRYNISPDFGTPIFPGEVVTITGEAYAKDFPIKSIFFYLGSIGEQTTYQMYGNVSIPKGTAGTFTISQIAEPNTPSWAGDEFSSRFVKSIFDVSSVIYSKPDRDASDYSLSLVAFGPSASLQYAVFAKYRLIPTINELKFQRVRQAGSKYIDDDGGNYIRCASMKLGKNSAGGAVNADFSIIQFSYGIAGGGTTNKTLTYSDPKFTSAMDSGYMEASTPVLFTGQFLPGETYEITLTIGDQYEQTSTTITIPRAFANLHLSGAPQGGVAIGQYSSVDPNDPNDPPKFEVAPSFMSHLYGGADIPGINSYQEGDYLTGGTWIDGKPIYRFVHYEPQIKLEAKANQNVLPLGFTVDTMLKIEGAVMLLDENTWIPNCASGGTSNSHLYMACMRIYNSNTMGIELGTNIVSRNPSGIGYVFVMYCTKI